MEWTKPILIKTVSNDAPFLVEKEKRRV